MYYFTRMTGWVCLWGGVGGGGGTGVGGRLYVSMQQTSNTHAPASTTTLFP